MNVTMKQVFASLFALSAVGLARGSEFYDASDYVQTGLIAHWDAVENAGRGQRDASRATWKDLTGTHDDLVFPNGCVMGTDANGVSFYNLAKDEQGKDHGCWLSSCADVAQALLNKDCTIEIVCDFVSRVDDGALVAVLDGSPSKRFLSVRSYESNLLHRGTIGPAEYLASGWIASGLHIDQSVDSFNFVRSYAMLAGDVCRFYRNGQNTESSISPGTGGNALRDADPQRAALSFGFWRTSAETAAETEVSDIKIYAIRIYNRELTADELAANYRIDQARLFKGEFIVDHQLVIASEAGEIGEPEPFYGRHQVAPGEETTCEAPETVETASATFTCAGCQLYTNALEDASVWLPWGEERAGNSAAFTFPAEGNVKVVWKWAVEAKPLASSFEKSFGSGRDAVSVLYTISDFSGIPEVGVQLQYGTTPESLDLVSDGGVITSGGIKGVIFRGLESGRCYWGKVVFTVAGKDVSETEAFTFATTDRIAYWPLNSSNLGKNGSTTYFTDQSGNGYELVTDPGHIAVESDPDSPDGECVRMDGAGSYLKTIHDPSTVGSDWLWLDQAEGLTFFFRLKGCAGSDQATTSYDIFETSDNYSAWEGALLVCAEKRDGKWYLAVGEKGKSTFAYYRCTEPLDDSDWQNVVVVFARKHAPDCFAVYVNGVPQTLELFENYKDSMKDVPYASQYLHIGGRNGAGTTVGLLDDFGICGYAYDADEVAQLTDELSAKSGSLFVEATDSGACSMQPAAGDHSGFAAGQVVPFERKDSDGITRGWSLLEYDDAHGEWTEVKRGYGHCGTFTHTGGRMRLRWDVDKTSLPICRWTFDDRTGRNTGSFGTDCDMEFSGTTAAADGYLAVPKEETAFAATKNNLPLSAFEGLTASFWVRDIDKRADTLLLELSENYNNGNGRFCLAYDKEKHFFEMGVHYDNYSYETCALGADDVLADDNWHHCTVVYRMAASPNIDLYIDGVQKQTKVEISKDLTNAKFADNCKFYLCHRGTANTTKADLDNVTLYPQALTAGGVAALYAAERQEKGGAAAVAVPDDAATLVVTAKKAVPTGDLPIPDFGTTCLCTAGKTLSFDFTRGPYTVAGSQGKYRLTGWKLYRLVDGEWTIYQSSSNPLVEFVHPGGAVKLELNFAVPGMAILFQ